MGFDFKVEYKAWKLNQVVDALSCSDEAEIFSNPSIPLFDAIQEETNASNTLKEMHTGVEKDALYIC